MTYCLALRLDEGLVFLADTRTNAGIDNIGHYRKLHVLHGAPDRLFVLESAGNLATTQEVLDRIRRDLAAPPEDGTTLATVSHLFEAALYVGRIAREVVEGHREGLAGSGADGTATFILGGQVGREDPDILLVYPEGNYIRASDDQPFLQIGELKYGKYLLELAVRPEVEAIVATKIAIASMMTTARANLSVGPPYDLGIYLNGSYELDEFRLDESSPVMAQLREVWEQHMLAAFEELPSITRGDLAARDLAELAARARRTEAEETPSGDS